VRLNVLPGYEVLFIQFRQAETLDFMHQDFLPWTILILILFF